MKSLDELAMRELRLRMPLTKTDLESLRLGDVVFLDGIVFTGREGLYQLLFDEEQIPPVDFSSLTNVTFHCSPAVTETSPGVYSIPSVTATASFRFDQYMGRLFSEHGVRAVIGKGGMQKSVYEGAFQQHGAVYLTTVGYGLGATYGQGIRSVKDVIWKDELGLAQAVWILEVKNFGPFLVECDCHGRGLFEKANVEVNRTLEDAYRDLPSPKLKRIGEVTSPGDEVL